MNLFHQLLLREIIPLSLLGSSFVSPLPFRRMTDFSTPPRETPLSGVIGGLFGFPFFRYRLPRFFECPSYGIRSSRLEFTVSALLLPGPPFFSFFSGKKSEVLLPLAPSLSPHTLPFSQPRARSVLLGLLLLSREAFCAGTDSLPQGGRSAGPNAPTGGLFLPTPSFS